MPDAVDPNWASLGAGRAPVLLGVVERLQVQRMPLKTGPRGARVYDPTPLLQVHGLRVTPRGVLGVTPAGEVVDVHHADHPRTRNRRLSNGLSVLPAVHYEHMRHDFGAHMLPGCAGENLLLATDGAWDAQELDQDVHEGRLVLETVDGLLVRIDAAAPAPPCVEFARFALRRDPGPVDEQVRAAVDALGGGRRGFYLSTTGTGTVTAGARLLRQPLSP